mgnify:CR=1 FL=1
MFCLCGMRLLNKRRTCDTKNWISLAAHIWVNTWICAVGWFSERRSCTKKENPWRGSVGVICSDWLIVAEAVTPMQFNFRKVHREKCRKVLQLARFLEHAVYINPSSFSSTPIAVKKRVLRDSYFTHSFTFQWSNSQIYVHKGLFFYDVNLECNDLGWK